MSPSFVNVKSRTRNNHLFRTSSALLHWLLLLIGLWCTSTIATESSAVGTATETCNATSAPTAGASDECPNMLDSKKSPLSATDRAFIFEQILANDYSGLDGDSLIRSIQTLKDKGAHRCWHKHSTFLDHLLGVHNILRLWGQGPTIGRVGLFHSAYSNSYVNLALFNVEKERDTMKSLVGEAAEKLVYLFCIIDRQQVVVNTLVRQGYIPREGLTVPHLKYPNEQTVFLSAKTLRLLVVFSMADFSDQMFGWQDELFGGPGAMLLPDQDKRESHNPEAIWPGISKPGLWMTNVNKLALVAATYQPEWSDDADGYQDALSSDCVLDMPPVFDNCTKSLTLEDEIIARDLYWSVIMGDVTGNKNITKTLKACREHNPWIFEPLILLAQQYLFQDEFQKAAEMASEALDLQEQWGTAWDKRLQFSAWRAWTKVLHQRASAQQSWPTNSWDVNNFGLVK